MFGLTSFNGRKNVDLFLYHLYSCIGTDLIAFTFLLFSCIFILFYLIYVCYLAALHDNVFSVFAFQLPRKQDKQLVVN